MRCITGRFYTFGLILGVLIFWVLRGLYWLQVDELPFSDMADFERIAHGILTDFSFQFDTFWRSYKSPTLPVLGATVWGIFGLKNYLAWRIFQALLLLAGLLWLTRELRLRTRTHWVPLLLLWTVAISKPSIFWSYKYATESVAEGLLYLSSAATLCALRTNALSPAFLAGLLCTISVLNRPNYAVCIPLVGLLLLFRQENSGLLPRITRRSITLATTFSLGVILLWAPWIYRGYKLYGSILLTNTSGGHSFIFDLGTLHVTLPDGSTFHGSNNDLLAEAPTRFANDYESHRYARGIFRAWLAEDPQRYMELVWLRFKGTLIEHSVFLTTLSRTELFQSPVDRLLPDKSPLIVFLGALALIGLSIRYGLPLIVLAWVAIVPWWAAILVANTSRYLDPMVPLLTFGFFLVPVALLQYLPSILRYGRLGLAPSVGR